MTILKGIHENRLTPAEERILAEVVQRFQTGAKREKAILSLVENNLREAFLYAKGCCSSGRIPDDVLLSVCYEGLSQAVVNFRPGIIRFFAYAKPYIRGAIFRSWSNRGLVRFPRALKASVTYCGMEELTDSERGVEYPDNRRLDQQEKMNRLVGVLERLNATERRVLKLRYSQEMSFDEIGARLGVSRSAAWATHKRAIFKIRRWMPPSLRD